MAQTKSGSSRGAAAKKSTAKKSAGSSRSSAAKKTGGKNAPVSTARKGTPPAPAEDDVDSQREEITRAIEQSAGENTGEYTFPPLSTVRPPLQQLGYEAAKMMLELQSDPSKAIKNDKPVNIYLPCELIERGTTKKQSK